jgi:hypothetical protein
MVIKKYKYDYNINTKINVHRIFFCKPDRNRLGDVRRQIDVIQVENVHHIGPGVINRPMGTSCLHKRRFFLASYHGLLGSLLHAICYMLLHMLLVLDNDY